ncbi:MAG: class I SAM-dependent methyltransferase, partial [Tepidisphaeraceae bacterium]
MISLNNEPCVICGETRSALMQETTYPEHDYPGSFCLRRCAGCGLLFNSPRLDDSELSALYGRNYYFFARSDERELLRSVGIYQRTIALVEDATTEKRCLDVGSGRGYFPALLKALGWDARGVEISEDAVAYARRQFHLEMFTGTAEQFTASSDGRAFPLVTAIDVIEHVPSPASFVEALAKLVEPRGTLIIDTPNAASENIPAQKTRWPGFNPFHIFLFSPTNLGRLLEKHGFAVQRSFSYHNLPADEA